jgi:hypothetical protein
MSLVEVLMLLGEKACELVVAGGELRIEANGGAEALLDGVGVCFAEVLHGELGEVEVGEVVVGAKIDGLAEPLASGGAVVFLEGDGAESLAGLSVLWIRSEDRFGKGFGFAGATDGSEDAGADGVGPRFGEDLRFEAGFVDGRGRTVQGEVPVLAFANVRRELGLEDFEVAECLLAGNRGVLVVATKIEVILKAVRMVLMVSYKEEVGEGPGFGVKDARFSSWW